ncbi:hypothetical protein HHI36_009340 [Cryptolaemus montrouzieri]|uniref:Peptidase A2 domain-containing protein n=1 Tax=Cryptolaemus montrouzieri TaxID=559131 RepID=A0ABD2MUY3_9CUCU
MIASSVERDIARESAQLLVKFVSKKPNYLETGCKIDTGAQCNVLPANLFEDLSEINAGRKHKMQTANLNAYEGTNIEIVGSTKLNCVIRSKEVLNTFLIVNTGGILILGLKTCLE